MSDIDITLYLNEYRVRALADALGLEIRLPKRSRIN